MTGGAIVVPGEARFKPSIRVGHFFQAERLSFHLARTKACRSNVLVSARRQPGLLPDDHDDGVLHDIDNVGGEDEVGELTKAVLVCRREGGVGGWLRGGDSRTEALITSQQIALQNPLLCLILARLHPISMFQPGPPSR